MARGQRWKVTGGPPDGIAVREFSEGVDEFAEKLPRGAVVEELEATSDSVHFKRISGVGPLCGWASIKAHSGHDQLSKMTVAPKRAPVSSDGAPPPPLRGVGRIAAEQGQVVTGSGRQWVVVCPDGSVVWKGQRLASLKLRERLPYGTVVEEVSCLGDRLEFLNSSGVGPVQGWLSTVEKGKELLQPVLLPSSADLTPSFQSLKKGFLMGGKTLSAQESKGETEKPLGGWARLSELFSQSAEEPPAEWERMPTGALAAETFGMRRKPRGELPAMEELEHLDGAGLVEALGLDEAAAREFAGFSQARKRKMIAEAKALMDLGPEKRLEVLESYKKAWPSGPFPELTPSVEEPFLLPAGTCFPFSRRLSEVPTGGAALPEWGLLSPAGRAGALQSFFRRQASSGAQAQKEYLRALRCEVPAAAGESPKAQVEQGLRRLDPCRLEGAVDKDQLSGTIVAKGAVRPDEVMKYFNSELRRRVCLLDGGLARRISQEKLGEADVRGERFKNFKEVDSSGKVISLLANLDLLTLTKASLITDVHKEFLLAGSDVVRTNTFGCNSLSQQQYKTHKLVYEMNKAAAQLAKKATAEVTKQDPQRPRFVAGVVGPTPCMMSTAQGAQWSEMVESYEEQIRGLVDGGVDMLMLDGIRDSLNAKAAMSAVEDYFDRLKRKKMPLLLSASTGEDGKMPSGQSAEAFCISLRYAQPLLLGVSPSWQRQTLQATCRAVAGAHAGWCSLVPNVEGQEPEAFASLAQECSQQGLLNFLGGDGALPSHIAAASRVLSSATARSLPGLPATPYLQLAGLEALHAGPEEGLQIVGSQGSVMGSARLKKRMGAFKATGKARYLQEALEVCVEQCEQGADLLDLNLDSDMTAGMACPARSAMASFLKVLSGEPRVARVPLVLCSCDWETIKEGLRCLPGKSLVSGISLALGEEEFLRIARECLHLGAAVVVLAITSEGQPAESSEEKVRICRKSYELLRSRLDFPPEDIVFDCQVLLLGLPEYASRAADFIRALAELKRSCPSASFIAGVNNLSLAFRGLDMLRDALHSTFLYHAIPKGLNLAIAWPGALPMYSELHAETRTLCDEMVLNSSSDGRHFERFSAFVNFRSNSLTCLPFQQPGLPEQVAASSKTSLAVRKEAKETQRALLATRRVASAGQQKVYLRSQKCVVTCTTEQIPANREAALVEPSRVGGAVNREGLASTITAKSSVRPAETARYLNAELGRRVCVLGMPTGGSSSDYKDFFAAGCDLCCTSTAPSATYEETKAAAQAAKTAAAESTRSDSAKPRFVAGVMVAGVGGAEESWEEVVAGYMCQVQGLVDGGADLLMLDRIADALKAKAGVFAIEEYFEQTGKERLPLLLTLEVSAGGKLPSGQSIEAFLVSLGHARPLSVGLRGEAGQVPSGAACEALAGACPVWCHALELGAEGGAKFKFNFQGASSPAAARTATAAATGPGRSLPAGRKGTLQLAGLELASQGGFQLVGQRCNAGACARFRGFVDAYKYTREGNRWEFALDVCKTQAAAGADLLDINFDAALVDSKWAMRKFLRLCAADPEVAKLPLVLSSTTWPAIEEGLRNTQGKSLVNAISLLQGEEEFLCLAKACRRYGAAVVVVTMDSLEEASSYAEKVRVGQQAYKLLRSRLDFPAEDIVFDCSLFARGPEGAKDFIDAVAELKRTCPLVSFIAGLGNLSTPFRSAGPLREALHSVFLQHAIPMGLNMALVEPGALPCYTDLEAQSKKVCEEVVLRGGSEASTVEQLEAYAAYLSGGLAEEIPASLAVPGYSLPEAISRPRRASPGLSQPIHTLVQGTGTINASIFQTFGSKCHTATIFHRNQAGLAVKRQVWFSSISAWMGQGGSGPITGCSSVMDGISLYERWQNLQSVGVSVEWGAIGEIGLRRTIYGSRDVFAQFDLGQKLIGPADTQFLMRAVCCLQADPYEVIGLAYLDQTWQMTLAGATSGGGLERKTFADM